MNVKTSKSHPGFSLFFPVWLCFNATARLCSEWGLWDGLGLGDWEIVRNSRGMYLVLWLSGPYQYPFLGLGFISIFWTCAWFCWCKYFPACIHHLSLSAWSRCILVDELRAELSSASAHMCWKLCGRLASNLFCHSWLSQQSLHCLFPKMHWTCHIPEGRNEMKACFPAFGTKVAFSHPLDITIETNSLHHSLLHKIVRDLSCIYP